MSLKLHVKKESNLEVRFVVLHEEIMAQPQCVHIATVATFSKAIFTTNPLLAKNVTLFHSQ